MPLEKPDCYREVPALQDGEDIFAEDHNQIIANIEKLKGGKNYEAPASNIKELKTILDDIIDKKALTASQISFDNEKSKLIYKKYNFPKFKTNIETIDLILTDENGSNEYSAVIEKEEDNYRMKAIINNFHVNNYLCFIVKTVNNSEDLEFKYNILAQFFDINKNITPQLGSNECIISDMDCPFVFNISINLSKLVLTIVKASFPAEIPEKNYNIILNIKNRLLNKLDRNIYFLFAGSINPFKLELIKTDNKVRFKGHYIYKTSLIPPICYSPILENYFNIINDTDDLINTEYIISSLGKPKKFAFVRYNNKPNTYYLKIENQDGSDIEENEIISFDLIPDKNAEIEVKEKVIETVQDAIESMSNTYYGDFEPIEPTEPEETNVYYFEKTTLTLELEGESYNITSNIIKDISNLSLVKNADGSLNLKGSFEISNEGYGVIRVNKKIKLDKRKLLAMSYKDIPVIYKYQDDYLYIIIMASKVQNIVLDLENIKIYNSNIICPADSIYIKLMGNNISDDFGIYLENGVYKLKGSFTSSSDSMKFAVNLSIQEFFENAKTYNYDSYNIQFQTAEPLYAMCAISGVTPNQEYFLDIDCPLQPSI